MRYTKTLESPIGPLTLEEENHALIALSFGRAIVENSTPFLEKCAQELKEYFAGTRTKFDLPLQPKGTDFQQRVWDALRQIPYGKTRTYGEIAAAVGSPKGARAIGMACNRNPIALVIPCHRVIGNNGSLTGYAGGIEIKAFLLRLEGHDL